MSSEPLTIEGHALPQLIEAVKKIAKHAGEKILEVYESDDFNVEQKADDSPLTRADLAAHNTIISGLQQLTSIPILSEESATIDFSERSTWSRYWLVDPLDGTREFIKRNGEFTVNIALIDNHDVILGVVYVPVTDVSYYAAQGMGAFKEESNQAARVINTRTTDMKKLTVAGSRSHGSPKLKSFIAILNTEVDVISIGSSLKSCLVAEGQADIYPRFGLTSEWDTAAAQCVVEQAGGQLTDLNLQPLLYNTKESLLNPHFLVFGDASPAWADYLAQAENEAN
ncbi:3'(2'),5'-bisphosphate nucleotidase CysQ [Candidatus Albibeggiatoa sp. nov. BB20]|uniref:3'(2'),5'-bisphosphate nucleotidase CysQ n=1 Tax=Candidatus Albibeggiatoa sp. nov. BB20 TaxID=3162723 RepID=UPI0033659985